MFGRNKISKIIPKGGDTLEVVKIFPTLQGEGPFVGTPAIFIRLGGCNLQCKFCDTEFDHSTLMTISDINKKIDAIISQNHKIKLIVITGGEPLRQPVETLCRNLIEKKFQVQIETNGTIHRTLPEEVTIICSPKMIDGKYNITREIENYVDYFKFLVEKTGEYSLLPKLSTNKPVYIQAIDSYNEKTNSDNISYALDLALQNNYRLSVQIHKILNIE